MYKNLLILTLLIPLAVAGQKHLSNTLQNNHVVSDFEQLSLQQFLDTGDYYFDRQRMDTALIYYNMLITHSRTHNI